MNLKLNQVILTKSETSLFTVLLSYIHNFYNINLQYLLLLTSVNDFYA